MILPPRRPAQLGSIAPCLTGFALHADLCWICILLCSLGLWADIVVAQDADPFAAAVRPTPHLTPEQEQVRLHVPEGFELQLFAAEPDIAKPLNMAIDHRGRLWVTDTLEYPYPAAPGSAGRDSIKVLEDTDGDGRADRMTTFADGLNIPIGIYPYRQGAIAFSIPNIWYLEDTDDDGHCDRRHQLLGPFGYDRDAHGLNNAFRRGFDGWVYACHGFNNLSEVRGRDGHQVVMQSGNTYRFRTDGSRIEHYTHGQVNPFGMAQDRWGNLFTADCHSKPIYALLRGGFYPSFGKPDDGLGFVPPVMDHLHGSTAISGLVVYDCPRAPAEFQQNFLSGNVMTSRVNRNLLSWEGSTVTAIEQPDFLVSDDPWFRPVDLQMGPDGALYIADFYNRIIGHYEVPLDHPGRDRTSGRIWRVVPKSTQPAPTIVGLDHLSLEQLFAELDSSSLARRLQVTDWLVDSVGERAATFLRSQLDLPEISCWQKVHALWVLHRVAEVEDAVLERLAGDTDPLVRTHVLKILSEMEVWSAVERRVALLGLSDNDALVQRAAADALGRHPQSNQVYRLAERLRDVSPADTHLRHVLRMALRDHLAVPGELERIAQPEVSKWEIAAAIDVVFGIHRQDSARFLTWAMQNECLDEELWETSLEHVCRYGSPSDLNPWITFFTTQDRFPLPVQLRLLQQIRSSFEQQGQPAPPAARDWTQRLVSGLLARVDENLEATLAWNRIAQPAGAELPPDLPAQARPAQGVAGAELFYDTLPLGEQTVGRWTTESFVCPGQLDFYLAGHRGFPDQPAHEKNRLELRSATTDEVLKVAFPPRNDLAQPIHWDLQALAGQNVTISLIDEDNDTAYAWLAAGQFSVPQLNPSPVLAELQSALEMTTTYQLQEFAPRLAKLALSDRVSRQVAGQLAVALSQLQVDWHSAVLAEGLRSLSLPDPLYASVLAEICRRSAPRAAEGTTSETSDANDLIAELFRLCDASRRLQLAEQLAQSGEGFEQLVKLVEQGTVPVALLQRAAIRGALAGAPAAIQQRTAPLLERLPAEPVDLDERIASLAETFRHQGGDAHRGAAVFTQHCAACHQRAGQGALVGPQLDGIAQRGVNRICEDILAPNRNVDLAFRTSTVVTETGRIVTGLIVDLPEAATLKIIDAKGQPQSLPRDDVAERHASPLSLMPDQVVDQLSPPQLLDLLAYLMDKPESGSEPN